MRSRRPVVVALRYWFEFANALNPSPEAALAESAMPLAK